MSLPWTAFTQISAGSAYMQGQYVELAVSPCGNHISEDTPPEGILGAYHFVNEPYGVICDSDKEEWSDFCGDFFSPGIPVHSWAIQLGSQVYSNSDACTGYGSPTSDIPGNIVNYSHSAIGQSVTWEGELEGIAFQKLSILKSIELLDTALFYTTSYLITNTGEVDINSFYLAENLDPDNDFNCTESYDTYNSIELNTPWSDTSWVSATGLICDCYIGLVTTDSRSRASRGNFFIEPAIPEQMYNGTGGYDITGGMECDCSIQLVFQIDLPAGVSTHISFSTVFSPEESDPAINQQATVLYADDSPVLVGQDVVLCEGNSIELFVDGPDDFEWTWEPSFYLSTTTGESTSCSATETTEYILIGTNGTDSLVKVINVLVDPVMLPIIETVPINGTTTPGVATVTSIEGGTPPYSYSWHNGDDDSSTTILAPGIYEVTITDLYGCTQTTSYYIDIVNEISDSTNDLQKVYPNPAAETIFISGLGSEPSQIQVIDMLGNLVYQRKRNNEDVIVVDVNEWPSGIYLVRISNENGHFVQQLSIVRP